MKQIIQNYKTGELKVVEVPLPAVRSSLLLIKTRNSLISAGTERTKVETVRMTLIEKAISRLDLVKIVLNNIKQEGLIFTLKKAFNKLDTPITLGYSCSGEVIEVGENVSEFKIRDRVACVGENYATHSEINLVPENFAVHIPENVDFEEASFVGLGAIALNAVEISQLMAGEKVVVIGLGLLGQLVAQIVSARGGEVLGIEIDDKKIELAKSLGLKVGINPVNDDVETSVRNFTGDKGADVIIITAASKNNLPIEIAGKISRNKGRVILVGAMPIVIPRKEYYEKELVFVISRGFGADLYYPIDKDRNYAFNYRPISIKENMKNFLSLVSERKIQIVPLITYRFNIEEAPSAYDLIKSGSNYLGIVFEYKKELLLTRKVVQKEKKEVKALEIGFVGAGSFAQGYILPELKKNKEINLRGVATSSGVTAKSVADKFGFGYFTSDYNEILNDEKINCIFIMTKHNLHAKLVKEALKKGKYIFVEKPLCLNEEELKEIISVVEDYKVRFNKEPVIMVGFNRRFSPFIQEVKIFFKHRSGPLNIIYRINAGYLPPTHWLYDPKIGGGRILGEVCHFVDLLFYINESSPKILFASGSEKNCIITIEYEDNSIGVINYNSIGDLAFPRERIEIFGDNSVAVIDNFHEGIFSRSGIKKKISKFGRDMGYNNEIKIFIDNLYNNLGSPIKFNEILVSTLTTFKIEKALMCKEKIELDFNK